MIQLQFILYFNNYVLPLPFAILGDDTHQGDGLESAMRVRLYTHSDTLSQTVLHYCYKETNRDFYCYKETYRDGYCYKKNTRDGYCYKEIQTVIATMISDVIATKNCYKMYRLVENYFWPGILQITKIIVIYLMGNFTSSGFLLIGNFPHKQLIFVIKYFHHWIFFFISPGMSSVIFIEFLVFPKFSMIVFFFIYFFIWDFSNPDNPNQGLWFSSSWISPSIDISLCVIFIIRNS